MPQYFFILGRHPELSLAEIDQVMALLQVRSTTVASSKEFCIIEADQDIDAVALLQRLGGCLKIGLVNEEFATRETLGEMLQDAARVSTLVPLEKHRVEFGLSIYGTKKSGVLGKRYGLTLKKTLRAAGHSVRMLFDPTGQLSSVTVAKNGLLSKGFELCALEHEGRIWLGRTQAIQSFRKFSERDYGRPDRDARSGMLPPKLALMMLNIAGVGPGSVLLDPFCGSGTVLQEAVLLGSKKVYGSDVSEKAVKDSQSNLDWLTRQEKVQSTVVIQKRDARHLRPGHAAESIDAIVTEPDLGAPRPIRSEAELAERRHAAAILYREFLASAGKVLKPDGRVVMVWPVWSYQNEQYFLDPRKVLPTGWKVFWPYTSLVPKNTRATLSYGRPDQFVAREIVVLRKS